MRRLVTLRRLATLPALSALLLLLIAPSAAAGGRSPGCPPCERIIPGELPQCPLTWKGVDDPVIAPRALVFSGGGVKGVAYPGSLGVLEESGVYGSVERVAGTSAGALIALISALGYTPDEMCGVVLSLDFEKFEDGSGFFGDLGRLKRDYGIFAGEYAYCVLQCLVQRSPLEDRFATFADLEAALDGAEATGLRRLYTIGTDLNLSRSEVYSIETTPDTPLALAARISMSIPLFFAAIRAPEVRDGVVNPELTDVWVDGGVLRNYPIQLFDAEDGTENPHVLGLNLGGNSERAGISSLRGYVERLVSTVLNSQIDALCRSQADIRRTAFVDPLGIGTTDFDLTRQQKLDLMQSGAKAAHGYLSGDVPDACPDRMMEMTHRQDFETFPMKPGGGD